MVVCNIQREITTDALIWDRYMQWKITCDSGTIFPDGEGILMGNMNSPEDGLNSDMFEILSTIVTLIRDSVEALWDKDSETLTFVNGIFFQFC